MSRAAVIIYNHPELYPPTLNAIEELSRAFEKVDVVQRPNYESKWRYPDNVRLTTWSYLEPAPIQFSTIRKIKQFFSFVRKVRALLIQSEPNIFLVYDYMALYAYYLTKSTTRKPAKVWYHNHDVPDYSQLKKYSIGWFARNIHQKMFASLDVFSIPSEERLKYFPTYLLKQEALVIPNYPAKRQFDYLKVIKNRKDKYLKIIYQGQIAEGHGIENIVQILGEEIEGKKVQLVLLGKGDNSFLKMIEQEIQKSDKEEYFSFLGFIPYKEVFQHTVNADIGLAMSPLNVNYETAGQASNKIYEYAACGLPVLYSNTKHYKKYLGKYAWALATDGSRRNLLVNIASAIVEYQKLSKSARQSFEEELNFETKFNDVMSRFK